MNISTRSVITVGAFDGVHLGHQQILRILKNKALEMSAESIAVTFWPHPSHVLGNKPLMLINSLEEKKKLLYRSGIDNLIVLPFTTEFSKINSQSFIKDFLIEQFGMKFFLLGYNHHFGNDRQGDINVIKEYGKQYGFEVEKAGPIEINGEKVSSTKIRNALMEGNIDLANSFLGYNYFISGIVAHGQMLGRTIGFPTANIQIDNEFKLLPKDGVYAVRVEVKGNIYNGMLNIGYRPTVNQNKHLKTIEVNILDFEDDIYDQPIQVHFIKRIRDEIKFNGIDNLKKQLSLDRTQALNYLT